MNSEVLSKAIAFSLALCIAAFAGAKEIQVTVDSLVGAAEMQENRAVSVETNRPGRKAEQ